MRTYTLFETPQENTETRLPGVLPNQPWIDYKLGAGISAITGARSVPGAVIDFDMANYPELEVKTSFYSISSEHDQHTAYGVEAKGSYNTSGLKVAASASFLSDSTYSESSMTIVAIYDIRSLGSGKTNPSSLALSEAGKKYLDEKGEEAFRERYGDYFISSQYAGARFVATYKVYTSSASSLMQFQANVSVSADMMSAEGSVKFEQDAHANNATLDCKFHMLGLNKLAPVFPNTPAGISQALQWFLTQDDKGDPVNLSFIPVRADLTHFSSLSDKITNVYPIEPATFADIQGLSFLITSMDSLASQLPDYFLNLQYNDTVTFGEERVKIKTEFEAAQDVLATKPELINDLDQRTTDLVTRLRPYLALVSFYNNLKTQQDSESHGGRTTHSQGTVSSPGGVSVIVEPSAESFSQKASSIVWERRNHTFNYSNADRIIVGWKIQDNWGDGTNGSWSVPDPIIGTSSASIKIEGEKGRGVNWTAIFYTAPKTDFPWISFSTTK
ncbi:hypothetical protein [Silvibacterium dinghuense]|uniref:Uncharacterized protein n=1 Tax=Silvibacterium dinghuense TaxID=1560006 RepID=A0A4Q1S8L6_9BACT|nr:hypothetical protein [Silvibacterium dinghuense]RXS93340.1 hypothetical protein ESZ00_18490 [Silvibacterium dinghuense]GGH05035.1 hypothetical protein GCM10011586_21430 [Silvibacterium dinghuense]